MPPFRWLSMQLQPVKIFFITLMHFWVYNLRDL
jgi:hypothetical protein